MAKKRHRELKDLIEEHVQDYDFEPGRTHIKIVLRSNGRERRLSVSSSPSCPHALNQFRRDLRKAVHELSEGLSPGAMWAKN